MKPHWKWGTAIGAGVLAIGTFIVLAEEQKLTLDQVPAKAREALLKAAGGARITEIEKENEKGVEVYEAEWVVDGKEHELAVTADGKPVAENEEAEDDELTIDQVPAKAREALLKLAGDNRITEVEKEKEHGVVAYEADWAVNGREYSACVSADGEIIETEETINTNDVPEAVRAAAAKLLPGAEKLKFEKTVKIEYEISGVVNGKKREIEVSPAGASGNGEGKDGGKDDDDDDDDQDDDDAKEAGK
jgi:uncharacterized membrane protein YkoI